MGDRFVAKNIGFENTAGAIEQQAVALRVQSDRAVFYNCAIDGYHNTLMVHSKRQFFRDCTISGTHEVVFGDSSAVFQNCTFLVRKPLDDVPVIIMTQLRTEKRQVSGFVVQGSSFETSPEFDPARKDVYLGTPLRKYSRVVVMESVIGGFVSPLGWLAPAGKVETTNTCWLAELKNTGEGAEIGERVTWGGIKTKIFTQQQAVGFTPSRFIFGDLWIKPTQVPYYSGFTVGPNPSVLTTEQQKPPGDAATAAAAAATMPVEPGQK